jgi:hypothetical protein
MSLERSQTWPTLPYKGLGYYAEEDASLFAGRDKDVVVCAAKLAEWKIRLLLLHGSTGCGKSSFLRAGLSRTRRGCSRRTERVPGRCRIMPSARLPPPSAIARSQRGSRDARPMPCGRSSRNGWPQLVRRAQEWPARPRGVSDRDVGSHVVCSRAVAGSPQPRVQGHGSVKRVARILS